MLIKRAKQVLKIESEAVKSLIKRLGKDFEKAVELIYSCKGRVVVTGMGKAGIIGQKISATLSSTGTPSLWLHSVEAVHGDLGRVTKEDVVLVISNSGQTEEVISLMPLIKKIGARLIALTGNTKSILAKNSDCILNIGIKEEACPLGLAPMASTTCMLAMGDALCAALMDKRGFKEKDFAFLHPGGSLGKRLILKVEDIMRTGRQNPIVRRDRLIKDVLLKITSSHAGSATVVDKNGRLLGIFTDGDLRRHLRRHLEVDYERIEKGYLHRKNAKVPQKRKVVSDNKTFAPLRDFAALRCRKKVFYSDFLTKKVCEVMTENPKIIRKGSLAVEALRILQEFKIDEIPVVDEKNRAIGLVDVQDLLKAGLV